MGTANETPDSYTIGELAAELGLTPRSIRFYEDQGLLAPVRVGSQRVYDRRDRARLGLICRGKRLGFTIAEIRDFLGLYDVDDSQSEQMRYLVGRGRERIAALEHQLLDVQETLTDLRGMVGAASEHPARANDIDKGAAP
ncbi:MAG: MerR family DNA-binding transcriptional regulator [Rhodospirillaceae bacterium]